MHYCALQGGVSVWEREIVYVRLGEERGVILPSHCEWIGQEK